ncbi:MAG: hypothetical protein ACQES2_00615 [Pseudomonadota bacterium]
MDISKKSRNVSFLLTLLLGPLGLLYVSPVWAILMIILAIVLLPTVVGTVAVWIFSIAIGDHLAHKKNQNIDKFMAAMQQGQAEK